MAFGAAGMIRTFIFREQVNWVTATAKGNEFQETFGALNT